MDFGLAAWTRGGADRAAAASRAQTTDDPPLLAAYLSPEELQGRPPDHRSDIFSFGIVLFEMLTGRRPFAAPTRIGLAAEISRAPVPAPSAVNKLLHPDFDAIVARALAKRPEDRYEAAAALAAELRSVAAVLDVRSGETEPQSVAPRRPQARRRAPLVAAMLAFAAIAALVMLWMAGRL